jgi:stage IV sporulation protein FB
VNEFSNPESNNSSGGFPPKPVITERKQNVVRRSVISLLFYTLLFYFIFDRNLSYISAIMAAIIIHELGHLLLMRKFNYGDPKLFIIPLLGAFTSGKKQSVSQRELCLILLGGPVPGIIIGCVLYWINKELKSDALSMLSNSFLIINLLNLLPFYPLDGGRLLETMFYKERHAIRLAFGIIAIVVLLILCLIMFNLLLLVIPIFVGLDLFSEIKHQKIRDYLREERINLNTDYESLPDKDYWLIRDCLIFSFPKQYSGLVPGKYEYSLMEPLLIRQISTILFFNLKPDLKGPGKVILLVSYLFALIAPLFLLLMLR